MIARDGSKINAHTFTGERKGGTLARDCFCLRSLLAACMLLLVTKSSLFSMGKAVDEKRGGDWEVWRTRGREGERKESERERDRKREMERLGERERGVREREKGE